MTDTLGEPAAHRPKSISGSRIIYDYGERQVIHCFPLNRSQEAIEFRPAKWPFKMVAMNTKERKLKLLVSLFSLSRRIIASGSRPWRWPADKGFQQQINQSFPQRSCCFKSESGSSLFAITKLTRAQIESGANEFATKRTPLGAPKWMFVNLPVQETLVLPLGAPVSRAIE